MKIKELFLKDIHRTIEGVIKADDDEYLFDEIDEYVITGEINQRLTSFLEYYNDYSGVNGAWISGFFGSGKSHLLKILSCVLENRSLLGDIPAAGIFLQKLDDDPLLKGAMEKAISIPSRSILFNIDQKADVVAKSQADAVLSVFMKVFNELRGYDPKIPYIADFEYAMDRQGYFDEFKRVFQDVSGKSWEESRDSVWLEAGDFAVALSRVRNISEDEAAKVLDKHEESYQLSIEDFAIQVKDYIDRQKPGFRLNFFVDEVGQYIADNVKLMTNLQTIAESLATKCRGQAWVIVTSQEDMDEVIGELNSQQANDFSKIQDRLACRMKLTSKNVAEVIQKRLLQKNNGRKKELIDIYEKECNNFKTLFGFTDTGRTYHLPRSEEEFIECYPFMPFHFDLLQSSIKGLSTHNAFEGKYRSVGERSMLGIFQEVGKKICESQVGFVASFDLMYEGIRTALKSLIQSDINSAEKNLSHRPLAVRVLKALLLVKYVKEFRATPRNLSILLIDHFDIDPIRHEKDILEALNILEQDTYLRRNGEIYEYLTDDEKDVETEIKNVDIDQSEVTKVLLDIIYNSLLKDSKIRYEDKDQDYPFNRLIDDISYGRAVSELSMNFITPLHKNYGKENISLMRSIQGSELVVELGEDKRLVEDLYLYKKTEKYCKIHQAESAKENIRRILSEKALQKEDLMRDLDARVRDTITGAAFFVNGEKLEIPYTDPKTKICSSFQQLVSRSYPHLKMLDKKYDEGQLQRILSEKADASIFDPEETMSEAEQELLNSLNMKKMEGKRETVKSIIDAFSTAPYGWWQAGTLCVLAKLFVRGKIDAKKDSNFLNKNELLTLLKNSHEHSRVIVDLRTAFSEVTVRNLKKFHQDLFSEPNSCSDAKDVAVAFEARLQKEVDELSHMSLAASKYPFAAELKKAQDELDRFTGKDYTFYLDELKEYEETLLELQETVVEPIKNFMNGEKKTKFDTITSFLAEQEANFSSVDGEKLKKLRQILDSKDVYKNNNLQEANALSREIKESVERELEEEKTKASKEIDQLLKTLRGQDKFSRLEPDKKTSLEKQFEVTRSLISENKFIFRVREIIQDFKSNSYPRILEEMDNMAKPQIKIGDTGDTGETTAKKSTYIPIGKIKVTFDKSTLESEIDVDDYLQRYRKILVDHVGKGTKIIISN